MKATLRRAWVTGVLWATCAGTLFAQQADPAFGVSTNWGEAFRSLDTGKLAIILIFGSGIIATLGYSIAGIVRAFNGSPDDAEDLTARLDELEERVKQLEAQAKTPVQV